MENMYIRTDEFGHIHISTDTIREQTFIFYTMKKAEKKFRKDNAVVGKHYIKLVI